MRLSHGASRAALAAAWLWAGCAGRAQITHPRDISLLEGRGELLQFQKDILRVVISEPKIADVAVISPREVMVNAKGPGKTTLVVWETDAAPAQFEIDVTKDTSEWDSFRKEIVESANGSPVTVTGSGETLVLAGTVKSAADSKRLAGIAQTHAKNVINLLQA